MGQQLDMSGLDQGADDAYDGFEPRTSKVTVDLGLPECAPYCRGQKFLVREHHVAGDVLKVCADPR